MTRDSWRLLACPDTALAALSRAGTLIVVVAVVAIICWSCSGRARCSLSLSLHQRQCVGCRHGANLSGHGNGTIGRGRAGYRHGICPCACLRRHLFHCHRRIGWLRGHHIHGLLRLLRLPLLLLLWLGLWFQVRFARLRLLLRLECSALRE